MTVKSNGIVPLLGTWQNIMQILQHIWLRAHADEELLIKNYQEKDAVL